MKRFVAVMVAVIFLLSGCKPTKGTTEYYDALYEKRCKLREKVINNPSDEQSKQLEEAISQELLEAYRNNEWCFPEQRITNASSIRIVENTIDAIDQFLVGDMSAEDLERRINELESLAKVDDQLKEHTFASDLGLLLSMVHICDVALEMGDTNDEALEIIKEYQQSFKLFIAK